MLKRRRTFVKVNIILFLFHLCHRKLVVRLVAAATRENKFSMLTQLVLSNWSGNFLLVVKKTIAVYVNVNISQQMGHGRKYDKRTKTHCTLEPSTLHKSVGSNSYMKYV